MFQNIHHTVTFATTPDVLYAALLNSESHAAFTDAKAQVSDTVGDTFNCYDGFITGVNVELVPNQRIVQAWRGASWDEGIYSLVTFNFEAVPEGVRLDFHHVGVPTAAHELINEGWTNRYWNRIEAWLAKG